MRIVFSFLLCLIVETSFSQLVIKPIQKERTPSRGRVSATKVVNKASLPFWDDFSITTDSPDSIRIWGNDTTTQWNYNASRDVFVNATLAINPPTYKVATFDGVDEDGNFHGDGEGRGDFLVSDTIDVSGASNIGLSFYWQAGGNVEMPDSRDSLVLQFYAKDSAQWYTVWSIDASDLLSNQDSVFTQEFVELDPEYRNDTFLFRFYNVGDLEGPYDAWHVDWIYLDNNRNRIEALEQGYEDASITQEPTSIISPFVSIPLNQFRTNNDYIRNPETSLSYLGRGPSSFFQIELNYEVTIKNNGNTLLEHSRAANPLTAQENYRNEIIGFTGDVTQTDPYIVSEQNLSPILGFDSVVLETTLSLFNDSLILLDDTPIDLRVNDTIRTELLLHNYYAYDDGTAEFAVGIEIPNGLVTVQYWLEEPDTLTHVDIYFPKIDSLRENEELRLQVYNNLDNSPIRNQRIRIQYGERLNEFVRYQLFQPILLSDTFYVGYSQEQDQFIGVGFDRSNPEAAPYIFDNTFGEWVQNTRLRGALMIRPIFSKADSFILGTNRKEKAWKVYPNPSNGTFRIEGEYNSITLMDFSGRVLLKEEYKLRHDITALRAGLYLLTIHRKEGDQTLKIIKE